jgi:Zn finger protein HypA/HybF involved in hydrogenase expression
MRNHDYAKLECTECGEMVSKYEWDAGICYECRYSLLSVEMTDEGVDYPDAATGEHPVEKP